MHKNKYIMKNCASTNMPKKKFRTARTKNKADKQPTIQKL